MAMTLNSLEANAVHSVKAKSKYQSLGICVTEIRPGSSICPMRETNNLHHLLQRQFISWHQDSILHITLHLFSYRVRLV